MLKWFNNLKLSQKITALVIFEAFFLTLLGLAGYYIGFGLDKTAALILTLFIITIAIISLITLGYFIAVFIAKPLFDITEKMREVTKPLSDITEKMREVAKGNFFVEPAKVRGKDEFAEPYKVFNAMTENLRDSANKEKILKERAQFLKDREVFLKQIMVALITSLDIKDTIRAIVNKTGEFFKADQCYYVEYEDKIQEHLPINDYAIYLSSLNIKDLAGLKFTKEQMQPVIRYVFLQKQALSINNVNEIEVPDETKDLFEELGVKSFLSSPIIFKEELIGRIGLHYVNEFKEFSKDDIDLITAISDQLATAIHQAKLYSQIEETKEREILLKTIISNTLLSSNLEEALRNIGEEVARLFNADRISFMFFDNTLQTFSEIKGEYRRKEDMPSAEGKVILEKNFEHYLIEELFIKKNSLIIDNNSRIPEGFIDLLKILYVKTAIAIPIFYRDKPIAVVLLNYAESTKQWNKEELDFLVPIAQQVSIGIYLFQLNEKLGKSVTTERTVRDIVLEARKLEDYKKIFDYLLDRLANIFGVDRVLNLHFTPDGNLSIRNEVIKNIDQAYSLGQDISNVKNIEQIFPDEPDKMVVINDINTDIKDPVLKEYFRSKRTISLLLYPIASRYLTKQQIIGIIMLCSSIPRKWTSDEMDSFKLMVDTTTLVYLEIKQKQDAEEERKTFLATLTHDLRSPLLAEQKSLEAVISKKFGTSLETFSEYLEDMHKTNDELLRLVNNLLLTYQYESGKTELELVSNNINDIIDNAVKSMKPLAEDNDSEIVTDIQPDSPLVMANGDEINRVITNLINNAIKHNTKGTNINVKVKKIDNEVQISVSDNGKGIPESERPYIFQRYPTTKRKIGSGLGLYLSKQIIDAHKGKIWFDTEKGKGTTFYFTLPVS